MTASIELLPPLHSAPAAVGPWPARLACLTACLLLALAQMALAGYQLGVGNQTIQIPFVQRALDPTLYPRDAMLNTTLRDYPSYFFTLLAPVAKLLGLARAYFTLHLIATFGVLAASLALCRAMFGRQRAGTLTGAIMLALLLAGHHHALAGDELYSTGFTHTWAVFPLAIVVLVLTFRGRLLAALGLAGVLVNLHALTAGYLLVPLLLVALTEVRERGIRRTIAALVLFVLFAAPTLVRLALQRQQFDAQWISLTYLRSADHSFPSTWWQAGDSTVPRMVLLLATAALAWSFRMRRRTRRIILCFAAGSAAMCLVGYVFADVWPIPAVLRAQLFRATRIALVLALALIAYGIYGAGFQACARYTQARRPALPTVLEVSAAVAVLATVSIPVLTIFLPHALLLTTLAALASGRLSWLQATLASAALVLAVYAARQLHFPVPGLPGFDLTQLGSDRLAPLTWISLASLVAGGVLVLLVLMRARGVTMLVASVAAAGLFVTAGASFSRRVMFPRPDPWLDAQRWARANTPREALFLTPPLQGGFRIHAQRSVVGEWRDGTQAYFSAPFARTWWTKMAALRPGIDLSIDGRRILAPGQRLEILGEKELLALAQTTGATHLVLPAGTAKKLIAAYRNPGWVIYLPQELPAPPVPAYAAKADVWRAQEPFLQDVVWPNIEKHRKTDATITLRDAAGRPVVAPYTLRQLTHRFDFGCSLPLFAENPAPSPEGYKPPVVKPVELERFREVFNFSMIPFSSKWGYIEPEEGKKNFAELDQYIDFCHQQQIATEFHFIAGLGPAWLKNKTPAEKRAAVLHHARVLLARYGAKVKYWQVTNDWHLGAQMAEVFTELRKINPQLKLGLSDCARLHSAEKDPQQRLARLCQGFGRVKELQQQGLKVDYFAPHAHQPYGLWPDAREMYESFDIYAAAGVKVHLTEVFVPLYRRPRDKDTPPKPQPVYGPVRKGEWTRELQAEYFERVITVAFSHPAVEAVNLWTLGPVARLPGEGILDENYHPTPAFAAIKRLIHETFTTQLAGQMPLDGTLKFRGFYGDYVLTVTLPDGTSAQTRFALEPGTPATIRLELDSGRLERR